MAYLVQCCAGPIAEHVFCYPWQYSDGGDGDDMGKALYAFPSVPRPPNYDRAVRALLRRVRR
jgi:hypothetical protein